METIQTFSYSVQNPRFNQKGLIPDNGEKAVQYALLFFPELKHVNFSIKASKSVFPIKCVPRWSSLFKKPANREYLITISSKTIQEFNPLLFENLSQSAQIGMVAQALARIAQYQQYSSWELIRVFFKYPFPEYREEWEKAVDKKTIDNGLGWELYDWANQFDKMAHENMALRYLQQFHLHPEEIIHYLQNLKIQKRWSLFSFQFNKN